MTSAAPAAAGAAAKSGVKPASEANDPENDQKLCSKIRDDFNESMAEINRRKLGKSGNESVLFKRRKTTKLVKRLAKDHELTEDQIKRIVGIKG